MKLKDLIRILRKADPCTVVAQGFGSGRSYRGSYDQIAFKPAQNTTVREMLEHAEAAIDQTYSGYKGGDYTMTGETPVWIAEYGQSGEEITVSMVMDWIEGKGVDASTSA